MFGTFLRFDIQFREVLLKYRDEGITHLKSARTITSKINIILKDKIADYGLTQLRSKHAWEFKKRISDGRKPKTINMYIDTLNSVWKYARTNLSIAVPAEAPASLVAKERVHNEREVDLTTADYERLLKEANNQPTKYGQWPFPILEAKCGATLRNSLDTYLNFQFMCHSLCSIAIYFLLFS